MSDKKPIVLIASYLEPEYIQQISEEVPDVQVIYRPDLLGKPRYNADHSSRPDRTPEQEAEWRSLLVQADILFDFDYGNLEDLPELAQNLKWIQATSAGIGQFVKRIGYADRTDWIFTTASGVHARPLAEFALMIMLMFAKDFPYLQAEKEAHHWARYSATELAGKTLGIVGLGNIGREVAQLARVFDMRIIGNRRDPSKSVPFVDQLYGHDGLHDVLKQSDYLVLATPHTPETENMIGATELDLLPDGVVLVNIARGAVIDEPALIKALQSGKIRGAGLDVFATEPLPAESPLWDMPNVIISPHSASTADTENQKITNIFVDNLRRFLSGQPMINVLDTLKLY